MIQADLRHSLTRNDAQLALHLVARDSAHDLAAAEEALRHDGIDALLDDTRLLTALLADSRAAYSSLPMFVYVVVRHSLRDLGEGERAVADYVASVVVHFASHDRAWRIVCTTTRRTTRSRRCAPTHRTVIRSAPFSRASIWRITRCGSLDSFRIT